MKAIARPADVKLVRERSRFLAYVFPVETVEEADAALARLRREHHAARHIPYAYRLPTGEGRASDDGEPAGSAGRPLLQLLEGEDLGGVLLAVVRYFGGVKLGVGGLARAYRDAAREALEAAGVRPLVPEEDLVVAVDPGRVGALLALAGKHGGRVLGTRFGNRVEVELRVAADKVPALRAAVAPWGEVWEARDG